VFSARYNDTLARIEAKTKAAQTVTEDDCLGDMITALDDAKWGYGEDNDDIRFVYKQLIVSQLDFLHKMAIAALRAQV